MSEVKCGTCKGEKTLTFEQGQRQVSCVTCSGSGIDWRKSYDTALSQLADLREELADANKLLGQASSMVNGATDEWHEKVQNLIGEK